MRYFTILSLVVAMASAKEHTKRTLRGNFQGRSGPVPHGIRVKPKPKPQQHSGSHGQGNGTGSNGKDNRIVGGTDASPNEYPFYVNWGNQCGGSLIYEDIVLTAAHCSVVEYNEVNVGAYENVDYIYYPSSASGVVRTISERIIHPDYNGDTFEYDYMLLKLSQPVTDITPVVLNDDRNTPSTGAALTVIGLGLLQDSTTIVPDVLQKVDIQAYSDSTCDSFYSDVTDINNDVMVCAGVDEGGKNSCQGDSGGPLLTADGKQVGVVSFGVICAEAQHPSVYSRVSAVKQDWIDQVICDYSANPPASCGSGSGGGGGGGTGGGSGGGGGGSSSSGTVTVAIMTDAYPEEVAWSITSATSDTTVAERQAGYYTADFNSLIYEEVELTAGESYWFRILDSAGDGICCTYGQGYFGVYSNAVEDYLFNLWGDYGSGWEEQFTVPGAANDDDAAQTDD